MDRFANHVVKTTPAADAGTFSGIAADKVSSETDCLAGYLSLIEMVLPCWMQQLWNTIRYDTMMKIYCVLENWQKTASLI